MTREEGLKQIDAARWELDDATHTLNLHVTSPGGWPVLAWLSLRPVYCDRGHIQLLVDGPLNLDHQDSFPRYFFSFAEADAHTRSFLKWRLWQHRTESEAATRKVFSRSSDRGEEDR